MWKYSTNLPRLLLSNRNFCSKSKNAIQENPESTTLKSEIQQSSSESKENLVYSDLKYETKVPLKPFEDITSQPQLDEDIEIDSKTIQLLERLSLVDLDSREALKTLKDSIKFANKIIHIDTKNIKPLYTVLEDQALYLREDKITEGDCKNEILSNAKIIEEDYFVAPPGNIPLEQEEKKFE